MNKESGSANNTDIAPAKEDDSAEEILQNFKTRISCSPMNQKESLSPLFPEEEKKIISILDELLKDYRGQTLKVCKQIRNTDALFCEREIQFESFDAGTEKKLQAIKGVLQTTKKELFETDEEINEALKAFEETYWGSSHSHAFRKAYEQRMSSIVDQQLIRADAVRNSQHLVKQVNDTINDHNRDKADQKRTRNTWIVALTTTSATLASALITEQYKLAVFFAGALGVVIGVRPKRPDHNHSKARRKLKIFNR